MEDMEHTIITGEPQRPGYAGVRDNAVNDANDAEDHAEKAAFASAARQQKIDEDARKRAMQNDQKAGFAASANPPVLPNDATRTGAGFDLVGKGWIYCGDDAQGKGTWIRDCGDSIEVPFSRRRATSGGMSEGQTRKIRELAQEKGWTKLYAFETNGRQLHKSATQELKAAGISCCSDQKEAKTLDTWKSLYRENCLRQCEADPLPPPQKYAEAARPQTA